MSDSCQSYGWVKSEAHGLYLCPEHAVNGPVRKVECGGCGMTARSDATPGWAFTDGPWCPRCAWLA